MSVKIELKFLKWNNLYRVLLKNIRQNNWRKINHCFCEILGDFKDIAIFNNILDELKTDYDLTNIVIFSKTDEPILQFLGSRIFVEDTSSDWKSKSLSQLMIKKPTKTDYLSFQSELIDMGLDKMAIYDPTYANDFIKLHSFLNNGNI